MKFITAKKESHLVVQAIYKEIAGNCISDVATKSASIKCANFLFDYILNQTNVSDQERKFFENCKNKTEKL